MQLTDSAFFNKTGSYVGNVMVGETILCLAQADITHNKFTPKGATIRLIVLQTFGTFSAFAPFAHPQILSHLKFLHILNGTILSCDISIPNFSDHNNRFEITGVIYELTILHQKENIEPGAKLNLHYSYDLPLCSIMASIRWTTSHNHLGRFNGVMKNYEWGDKESLVEAQKWSIS